MPWAPSRGESGRVRSFERPVRPVAAAPPDARDQLTAQELQIAQMAAEGLSNREIGQHLYLSHRTVASHLYRIFPKLDITSRSQLRQSLKGIASTTR
jgi:DNA-binding NarL/FixJ family response regulator